MRYPVRTTAAVFVTVLAAAGSAAGANPQLAGLQVALARHALYTGPIDAVPGPDTGAAIRSFQAHRGLVPDGIVGPITRKALGRFGKPLFGTRVIKPGMKGWDVAVLQYLLVHHRLLTSKPDGDFGPKTEAAVLRFQRARGLDPDGIVGPSTAGKLCKLAVCAWTAKAKPAAAEPAQSEPAQPKPVSVRSLLDRWASYYGVDPHLVRGLAWQESGYQPGVVSKQGAVGVMQLTPDTWAYVEMFVIGHPVAPSVEGNVQVGVAYLHYLLSIFGGNTESAVGAYLQGPASVRKYGISEETRVYVNNVLALASRL